MRFQTNPLAFSHSREDLENATDQSVAHASALASVMYRNLNARTSSNAHLIDKVPHYVQREKDRKAVAKRNKKNAVVKFKGHVFELKQFNQVEYCNQSQKIIWGIAPQGYKCSSKQLSNKSIIQPCIDILATSVISSSSCQMA